MGRIKRKCALKAYDWSMTNTIVEVDRNAFRLNEIYDQKVEAAKEKGEQVPISASPLTQLRVLNNTGKKNHEFNVELADKLKELINGQDMKAEEKKALLESLQVPPEGEGWQVRSHFILGKQYGWLLRRRTSTERI